MFGARALPRRDPLRTLIPIKRASNTRGLQLSLKLPNSRGYGRERSHAAMMHPTQAGMGLLRMGDANFVPANLEDEVRGKDVYDQVGQRVGSVEDLYVDRKEREVRFLEVGAGGFLGIGQKRFLVPVEAVVKVTEEWVAIEPGRTEKAQGPGPFDTRVAPAPAAGERRAEDYASPPYDDAGDDAERQSYTDSAFTFDHRPFR
jgi:sporulation protein YlmC with PRC-barrel domain